MITLKVTLNGIQPPIWRRIKISSQATLLDLHYVIQYAFGWTNTHLFMIKLGSMEFVDSTVWKEEADCFQSAELAVLGGFIPKLVPKGYKFTYIYDFGDNWMHEITVEEIDDTKHDLLSAICLDGRRASPPEDVGSVPGYYQLLENLQDPGSDDYVNALEWLGYGYDPEAFDLDSANLFLRDYFEASRLSEDTIWTRDLPIYNPSLDFIQAWTDKPEHYDYAEGVAFRQDVVTLLTYLSTHKVRGTKATGNFPRKDIREITAGFVNPPILDQQFGDNVYKLRTENEVLDLLFIHQFVNMAGLIIGGENSLWHVTHFGDLFMDRKPLEQVWFLTKFWFYQFDWDNCYPFDDVILIDHPLIFQKNLLKVLLSYSIGSPVEINKVLDDLDELSPEWLNVYGHYDMVEFKSRHYFENIVVEPFAKLGLFEVVKIESDIFTGYYDFTHVIMTDYGKTLLRCFT